MNVKGLILAGIVSTTISCQSVKKDIVSFDDYPVREGKLTEMDYSPAETKFSLWSPVAEEGGPSCVSIQYIKKCCI